MTANNQWIVAGSQDWDSSMFGFLRLIEPNPSQNTLLWLARQYCNSCWARFKFHTGASSIDAILNKNEIDVICAGSYEILIEDQDGPFALILSLTE